MTDGDVMPDVGLYEELREYRGEVIKQWVEGIFKTYPLDTVGFLRKKDDPFQNPVADRTKKACSAIVDALLKDGLDNEAIASPLDDIIRIRTVQDFSPAHAVGVIYLLKSAVRDLVSERLDNAAFCGELLQFESKLDSLALVAFDIYVKCNNVVYENRIQEIKRGQHMLLKRANMICNVSAEEPDTPNNP